MKPKPKVKIWKSVKLRANTINQLKILEGQMDLHIYDDVILKLISYWRDK